MPGSTRRGRGDRERERRVPEKAIGTANAARVSVGSLYDKNWKGLSIDRVPKRNENEHVTCTVVLYYTIAGGVPSEADVKRAIDDLEELYNNSNTGYLADSKLDYMKSELT